MTAIIPPAVEEMQVGVDVEPLRPVRRPPVAKLTVVDDDSQSDGEVFRLRNSSTTIGRRNSSICIANDSDISALHAVVSRTVDSDGKCTWELRDRSSTNGTYVRVKHRVLNETADLMIGAVSMRWSKNSQDNEVRLQRLGEAASESFLRRGRSIKIGRTIASVEVVLNDVTVNPVHAELEFKDGAWTIQDLDSRNGIWVRVDRYRLVNGSQFLLGEQRFIIEIPGQKSNPSGGLSLEDEYWRLKNRESS